MAKRKSAFFAAVEEAQQPADTHKLTLPSRPVETPATPPQQKPAREEVENRETPQNGEKQLEKVTFYLSPAQVEKLYDLVNEYRKRTGIRVNRNDLIRRMLDQVTLEQVLP